MKVSAFAPQLPDLAQSFNDAFQRLKYIKRYNAYRRQQAALITTTQTDLKKQMTGLRLKKQSRQKLVNEQVEQKKKLTVEKSEKDKSLLPPIITGIAFL